MTTNRISTNYIIFMAIAVLYAAGNFIWWKLNTPVLVISPASTGHLTDITVSSFLYFNAPLFTWIVKFCLHLFGKSHFDLIVICINYIFFLTALWFINKLGILLNNLLTGRYAMIVFAIVPAVYGMSRQYGHQDFHLTAFIAFNIYALLKSNSFENRKWSLLYGISTGLGMMTKDSFLIYFLPPLIYILIMGIRQHFKISQIKNTVISVCVSFLIFCPHYCRPEIIKKVMNEPFIETVNIFSFETLNQTILGLSENFLSPFIFIIFFLSLIVFIFKYKDKNKNVLFLWFFMPWAAVTFMPHHKLVEYLAAIIPAQALIIAISISFVKNFFIRNFIIFIICTAGFIQYIDISYYTGGKAKWLYFMAFNSHYRLFYYDKEYAMQIKNNADYILEKYSGKKIIMTDIYAFDLSRGFLKSLAYLNDKNIEFDSFNKKAAYTGAHDFLIYFSIKETENKTAGNDLNNLFTGKYCAVYEIYDFKMKDVFYTMTVLAPDKN